MAQHLAGGIAAQTCRCHTTPCRAQADSDKEFNNSATPLLVASQHGHADVTQLLCGAQADINKEFNDGATDIKKRNLTIEQHLRLWHLRADMQMSHNSSAKRELILTND